MAPVTEAVSASGNLTGFAGRLLRSRAGPRSGWRRHRSIPAVRADAVWMRNSQNARAHVAEEKRRAAVVAEAQQQLRLPAGELPLAVEVRGSLGAGGVAPQQPRDQRQGADAPQTEQRPHEGRAEPL